MDNGNKILSPMVDIIFKSLFGTENGIDILTDFLLAVLNLSPDEYDDITIANPFLIQEYKGDKLGILDVKLKLKSGKLINIEVQVDSMPFMKSRILFYLSKLITGQIGESDQYDKIKRAVSIVITGHHLIKQSDKFHHRFGLYDKENGIAFSDLMEIHTLEIPKAREMFDCTDNTRLLDWMKFFDAKSEEELNMLAQTSPVMKKATVRLMELSADEKARELYEARLKEQRDNYAREYGAVLQARFDFAKKLLRRERAIAEIVEDTGFTYDEIEIVRYADDYTELL